MAAIPIFYISCKKDDNSTDDTTPPVVTERQRIINEYNTGYLAPMLQIPFGQATLQPAMQAPSLGCT